MDTISSEPNSLLKNFKEEIQLPFSKNAYPALTDSFMAGKTLPEDVYINATKEVESSIARLKKEYYSIYR